MMIDRRRLLQRSVVLGILGAASPIQSRALKALLVAEERNGNDPGVQKAICRSGKSSRLRDFCWNRHGPPCRGAITRA
jgi:hypothetical protein